jgi:hypothetical protein
VYTKLYTKFASVPQKAMAQAEAKLKPALSDGLGLVRPSHEPWALSGWAQAAGFRLSQARTSLSVTKIKQESENARLAVCLDQHTSNKGQPPMPCGKFLSEHEQKNSHLCRIEGTQHVPVILSPALPRPDRDEEEYEQWCRSMLLIFKP